MFNYKDYGYGLWMDFSILTLFPGASSLGSYSVSESDILVENKEFNLSLAGSQRE